MGYFLLFVDMAGRRCAVVGGGQVATGKVQALLDAEASVTVVSPSLTPRLECLVGEERVTSLAREYRRGDLAGFAGPATPRSLSSAGERPRSSR